jgi:hypothetical protein
MQLRLPDGTVVLARGRLGLVPSERPSEPDFGLYLDERWDGDPRVYAKTRTSVVDPASRKSSQLHAQLPGQTIRLRE